MQFFKKDSRFINNNLSQYQADSLGRVSKLFSRLSISKKITVSYSIVLGVAVLGTICGFIFGEYQFRKALIQKEQHLIELGLLHNLENTLLQLQTHQHRLVLLNDVKTWQEQYSQWYKHATEFKKLWSEVKAYATRPNYKNENHTAATPKFIQDYESTSQIYVKEFNLLLKQYNPINITPEDIPIAKARFSYFTNSVISLKLGEASDVLGNMLNASYQDFRRNEAEIAKAAKLKEQIILASILSSVVIAFWLANFTSHAISRPIIAVNDVAQKVTQESNFNLQVPIITTDEVGTLAKSLNQLIEKVKILLEEQKAETSRQLIQSEKMSSLGQMLAGVAHEINNPINFIYGNIKHTSSYLEDLFTLLDTYETKASDDIIQATAEEIDLEFLKKDLPKLLQSLEIGAVRAREIVLSLKNFSRLDESEMHLVDLHSCIDSTLLILNNRIKNKINIVREYGELPNIEGYSGSLYQVFMNILSNAIDALEGEQEYKEITITTQRLEENWVVVKIMDNGCGIPQENQEKIFDSFFTTKPIGVGTGLGLSISNQIVVEKHDGRLTCESNGNGTTFAIALPIKQESTLVKILTQ
jgi:signal transduction histidine kinase